MSRLSNLKSRLIALAPVVLLILYSDIRNRHSIETDVRNNRSSLNFLAKENLNKFFDTTRLLLITLSQTAEVQKGSYSSISAFFRNLHKNYPDYVNIGMADLQGNLVCSALPMTRQINSSDLFWFQKAVKTREFSIGEYQIGRIAGMPVWVLTTCIRRGRKNEGGPLFVHQTGLAEAIGHGSQTPRRLCIYHNRPKSWISFS